MTFNLHERALEASGRYRRAQADLIPILQEVQSTGLFFERGHTSIFNYCVNELKLSEACALNFINVARTASEVPALQTAILNQELSISKARKIAPVVAKDPERWIELAKSSSSRRIEEEVAKVAPREAVSERLKPLSEDVWELRSAVSRETQEKLRRVQDLESQRTGRAVNLEETLQALLDLYLSTKDPIQRANRVLKKMSLSTEAADQGSLQPKLNPKPKPSAKPVPGHAGRVDAATQHYVRARDEGRCTHLDETGQRCEARRWLDLHHVKPRSEGGDNRVDNLVLLCRAHHRLEHS